MPGAGCSIDQSTTRIVMAPRRSASRLLPVGSEYQRRAAGDRWAPRVVQHGDALHTVDVAWLDERVADAAANLRDEESDGDVVLSVASRLALAAGVIAHSSTPRSGVLQSGADGAPF